MIEHDLIPHFGAEKAIEDIGTADVEALRDVLLERVVAPHGAEGAGRCCTG